MTSMRASRALIKIYDMQERLSSVGIDPAWVAVPIDLAADLNLHPSTQDSTLLGMRVLWVDATDPYLAVRA